MDFEFDHLKSATNLAKHGIDFLEAQSLWSDPSAGGASSNHRRGTLPGHWPDQTTTLVRRDYLSQSTDPADFRTPFTSRRGPAL